jgi:hypothetical protein
MGKSDKGKSDKEHCKCKCREPEKKLYEIVVTNLRLRSTPDTTNLNNSIQLFPPTIIIERLDDVIYPDTNPIPSGLSFIKVRFSCDPVVEGFVGFEQRDLSTGQVTSHFVLRTPSARATQKIIREELACNKC